MPSLLKMMAELGLNISPFQAGMKHAQSAADRGMQSIGSSIKAAVAGYFGFRALETAAINVAKRMAQIRDEADQFNITTDQVQKLSAAADAVGLSFGDMGQALLKVKQLREAIASGDQRAVDAANMFGIGEMVREGRSAIEIMERTGQALRGMKVDQATMDALREVFGKAGPKLAAALQGLGEDFGPLISAEDIDRVDGAEAAVKRLGREWSATVAPGIAHASESLSTFLAKFREVRKQFEDEKVPWYGRPIKFIAEAGEATKRTLEKPAQDAGGAFAAAFQKAIGDALGGKAEAAKAPVPEIVNPKRIADLREAQDKLRAAQEKLAFGSLNKSGQEAVLRGKIREINSDIATVAAHAAQSKEQEVQKEQRITELKLEQVELQERLNALQKQGGIGFEGYRKLAQAGSFAVAGGGGRAAEGGGITEWGKVVAANEKGLAALNAIHGALTKAGTLILGGR